MYCRRSVALDTYAENFQICICACGIQPVTSAWVSVRFGSGGLRGVQVVQVAVVVAVVVVVVENVPVPFFLLVGRRVRLAWVWIDDFIGIGKLERWPLRFTLKFLIVSPAGEVAKEGCLLL